MPYRSLLLVVVLLLTWTGCADEEGAGGDDDGGGQASGDSGGPATDGEAPGGDAGDAAGEIPPHPEGIPDGGTPDGEIPPHPEGIPDGGAPDGEIPPHPEGIPDGGIACGDCDDGIACSYDTCDTATGTCLHLAPDLDGDGVGDAACHGEGGNSLGHDCDDADPYAGHPDGPGVLLDTLIGGCDGHDNDCDGEIDEGCACVTGTTRSCGFSTGVCTPGVETCIDGAWGNFCEGAFGPFNETCGDGTDDDCNGTVDDVVAGYRPDVDGDGFGDGDVIEGCPPPGTPPGPPPPRDCDDGDPTVSPAAPEVCNGIDDDCDGLVDEDVDHVYYEDADGDGYGDDGLATRACAPPPGYVPTGGDCDGDPIKFPDAPERCDDFDNNCNEAIDEGCPCVEGTTRPCGRTEAACTPGTQRCFRGVWLGLCEGGVRPATETCNGIDDDCDGTIDEGLTVAKVRDRDGDGWGDGDVELVCEGTPGYVARGGDCDGGDAGVHPLAGFSSTPRATGDPRWDWNCDGWQQREFGGRRLVRCDSPTSACAYFGARWLETDAGRVAACGERGTLMGCLALPAGGCGVAALREDVLQRCR